MKINIQGNYNIYNNRVAEQGSAKVKSSTFADTLKADLNAISKGATELPDKHMLTMKSSVQSYVFSPTSPEQIAGIRERIQNGAYRIPTEDIVNAILGDDL